MFNNLSDRSKIFLQLGFVLLLAGGLSVLIYFLVMAKPSKESHSVLFRVNASGGYAVITLQAGDVKINKPLTVTSPWQKTVKVTRGEQVYLTASNPTLTGKLSCTIIVDNQAWQAETTDAPKNGVACAGIVP